MMGYGYGDGMTGGWNGNSMMGGWSLTWSILALVLVLAVAASVVLLVAWLVRRAPAVQGGMVARGGQEAGEILRRRFAAGDIDDEEFRRRLTVLDGP